MLIRTAELSDLPALLEIYNEQVCFGTATFDTEPKTLEERKGWFTAHNVDNHPLLSAVDDGEVVGYASLSLFKAKKAYDGTVEVSVYVRKDRRGQGVATALLTELIAIARSDSRTHLLVSVITSENTPSIELHRSFGFRECGTLHGAGIKFGRSLDVMYFELQV